MTRNLCVNLAFFLIFVASLFSLEAAMASGLNVTLNASASLDWWEVDDSYWGSDDELYDYYVSDAPDYSPRWTNYTTYHFIVSVSGSCNEPEAGAEMTDWEFVWTTSCGGETKSGSSNTFNISVDYFTTHVTVSAEVTASATNEETGEVTTHSGCATASLDLDFGDITPQPCPDGCDECDEEDEAGETSSYSMAYNNALGGQGFIYYPADSSTRVQYFSHNQGQGEATFDYVLKNETLKTEDAHYLKQGDIFGNGVKYIQVSQQAVNPNIPDSIAVKLLQYGPLMFEEAPVVVYDTKNLNAKESYRFSIPVDVSTLPTGNYNWQVKVTRHYSDGTTTHSNVSGRQGIFNNQQSALSRGWVIGFTPKLVKDGDEILLMSRGMHKYRLRKGEWVADVTYDLEQNKLTGDWDKGFTLTSKAGRVRKFDNNGRILSDMDRSARTTSYEYDSEGRLHRKTRPNKHATTFLYDEETGYLSRVVNRQGQETQFEQDDMGRIVKITSPDPDGKGPLSGEVTRFTYDENNMMTSVILPNGATTRFEYDFAGRISKTTHPDGRVESFVCPITAGQPNLKAGEGTKENPALPKPSKEIVGVAKDNGKATTTKYDVWGKPLSVTDPLGNTKEYVRNKRSQIVEEIELVMNGKGKVIGRKTQFRYDKKGNLIKHILPRDRGTRTWEYDSKTNAITKYVDETGLTTIYEIDLKTGNTIKETILAGPAEADHVVTQYCYSQPSRNPEMIPGGLLLASIDPIGYATGNAYDLRGHLIERFQYAEDAESHIASGNGMWKVKGLIAGKRYEVFATWSVNPQNTSNAVFSANQGKKKEAVFSTQVNQKTSTKRHLVGSLNQQDDYQSVGLFTAESDSVQIKVALAGKATGQIAGGKIRLVEIETLASYRYDVNDRLAAQTDANGIKTEFVYDALGRRIKTIRADGQTAETFYDFAGRRAYTKNHLGIVFGNSFDETSRSVEEFHFNPGVEPVEFQPTRKSQNKVEWALNNLDPKKRYEVLVSWGANNQISTNAVFTVKCGAGDTIKRTADLTIASGAHPIVGEGLRSLGTVGGKDGKIEVSLESEQDIIAGPLQILEIQSLTRYEYDLEGNLVASTDRLGNMTKYEYDKLGRPTKTISPTTDPNRPEAVSQTIYDQAGNAWKQIDPYGYVTESLYGPFGEIVKTIRVADDRRGNVQTLVTQFDYDKSGRIIKTTDPAGRTTESKYDSLSRRIETTNALGHSQKTEYDKMGRVLAEVDAAGNRTEHCYNLQGRRVSTKLPKPSKNEESPVYRQFYNTAGQLTGSVSPTERVNSYLYDEFGRQTATYLGLLMEEPSRRDEGKSVYTFEHLFPNESYCIFASWKSSPTSKSEISIKVYDILNDKSDEVHAGTVRSSENPKHDSWCPPFRSAVYQRLGETIVPKGNTISVELNGNLDDFNVYLVRVTPMSRTAYNEKGQVQSRTDARGNSVFFTYDAFGRQISALRDGDENHCCSEGKTFYNENGQVLASLATDGRLTINGYDALGRQNKSYLGYLTEVKTGQYNLEGLALGEEFELYTSEKADGKVDSLKLGDLTLVKQKTFTTAETTLRGTLDGQGHVVIVRKLPMQEMKFDFAGRTDASLDAKRNETSMFYDSLGRQIAVVQPAVEGMQTRLASHHYFDEAGNMTTQIVVPVDSKSLKEAGDRRATRIEYDLLDRVVKIIQPSPRGEDAGPIMRQEYDSVGNLIKTIDPLGNETRFAYDNLRRKNGEENAEGGVASFTYDSEGRMVSLTDPVGNTTSWTFGMSGRIVAEHIKIDGIRHDRLFFYDASNNIVSKVDRNGRITEYTFDKLNRHTSEIWFDDYRTWKEQAPSKVFKATYNRAGKMVTMDDGDNRFEFTYGIFGQEIHQKQTLGGLEKPVEFAFQTDISGLRTQHQAIVDGNVDHVNRYKFDDLGRMTSISQTGENLVDRSVRIAYDTSGQLETQERFEAEKPVAKTMNKYDGLGRIMNISHTKGETVFADYDISWDAGNRITDFDFTYLNGPPKKKSRYEYDKTSQLIGAKYDFMKNEMYKFDPNGNRVKAEIQGRPENYETGEFNRLLSDGENRFEFDAEGNRIAKLMDDQATKYFWDHRNRLVKVETPSETIEYMYDYKNRIVRRRQNEQSMVFVHDGWQIVMQFDGDGDDDLSGKNPSRRYLWGSKQDVLLCDNESWVLSDHLNTVRDLIKADGSVAAHLEYNAFGKLLINPELTETLLAYTGKLSDTKTGLQWNINRWCDVSVGRWCSEDSIGFEANDLNLMRYVGNSPLSRVDPMGQAWYGNFCGPGGGGVPIDDVDAACELHDACYARAGLAGVWGVLGPSCAGRRCDRSLCRDAGMANCHFNAACNTARTVIMGIFCSRGISPI